MEVDIISKSLTLRELAVEVIGAHFKSLSCLKYFSLHCFHFAGSGSEAEAHRSREVFPGFEPRGSAEHLNGLQHSDREDGYRSEGEIYRDQRPTGKHNWCCKSLVH